MMRPLTIGVMSLFLILSAGCSNRVVTKPEIVRVETIKYAPIPADLAQPCPGYTGPLETNEDLANAYLTERKEGTECANKRLEEIRKL